MKAKVLAVANQKGGVGKTTTALSLAAALAARGRKVLAMDLDPHAGASVHLKVYPDQVTHTSLDLFLVVGEDLDRAWELVRRREEGGGFDFVPATTRLSDLESDLAERHNKGAILRQALAGVKGEYDYVILDCPPHMGVLLVNALVASDLVLVPIQTDFLAVHGLKLLFETFRTLNRVLPKPLDYRVMATMFDNRANACRRVLTLLRKKMGDRIFKTVIHMDTKFREASARGGVISDLYPESRGARQYNNLANELESIW